MSDPDSGRTERHGRKGQRCGSRKRSMADEVFYMPMGWIDCYSERKGPGKYRYEGAKNEEAEIDRRQRCKSESDSLRWRWLRAIRREPQKKKKPDYQS